MTWTYYSRPSCSKYWRHMWLAPSPLLRPAMFSYIWQYNKRQRGGDPTYKTNSSLISHIHHLLMSFHISTAPVAYISSSLRSPCWSFVSSRPTDRPRKKSHPIRLCWHTVAPLKLPTEQLQMEVMYNCRSIWSVIHQSDRVIPTQPCHPLNCQAKNSDVYFVICWSKLYLWDLNALHVAIVHRSSPKWVKIYMYKVRAHRYVVEYSKRFVNTI